MNYKRLLSFSIFAVQSLIAMSDITDHVVDAALIASQSIGEMPLAAVLAWADSCQLPQELSGGISIETRYTWRVACHNCSDDTNEALNHDLAQHVRIARDAWWRPTVYIRPQNFNGNGRSIDVSKNALFRRLVIGVLGYRPLWTRRIIAEGFTSSSLDQLRCNRLSIMENTDLPTSFSAIKKLRETESAIFSLSNKIQ